MHFSEWPNRPTRTEGSRKLPDTLEEFRVELMRRVALLDREIRALDLGDSPDGSAGAGRLLGSSREELSELLAALGTSESWFDSRAEIIVVWRRCRHEFEQLAAEWQRQHAVRQVQLARGPRL